MPDYSIAAICGLVCAGVGIAMIVIICAGIRVLNGIL